jgi:predicted metal-dependent phosphoesterase TrpH
MRPDISRRRFLQGAVALGASWSILPRIAGAEQPPDGEWLAGDLHCHTIYSHDVWFPGDKNTGLDEAYTLGWHPNEQILIAESRGLDFLAITDHNDVQALSDPGYTSSKLTLLPGYEHSLSEGHAGCLGVGEVFEIDTQTDAGAIALRDAVHAAGGLFILNHPFYGSGWGYSNAVRPDSIEVWNIGWPFRKPLFQGVNTSENYKSLPYWESEFLTGGPMPATGGSDNHWRSTTAVAGVGQPTTWVHAADRSAAAVLGGIRAGRTTVSAEPPALLGPRLFLEAAAASSTWMIGDTVPATTGTVTVAARVVNAPGHFLRFVVDGVASDPILVLGFDATHTLELPAADHNRVRAELYLDPGYWMGALTSPIYFG